MGNASCAVNLVRGDHLASTDPTHISRWLSALNEGFRNTPRCTGVSANGSACRRPPLRGFSRCQHHISYLDRLASEREREKRYLKYATKPPTSGVARDAHAGLAAIGRRRLHRTWRKDPTVRGETITFASENDRQRTLNWLRELALVDITQPLPQTGRLPTPRAADRALWAGWRVVRMRGGASEQFIQNAIRRVDSAIKADVKFWTLWDALGPADDAHAGLFCESF